MSSEVDQIVAAVLYEGHLLYPYRPAVKNAQRWTFGVLYPRAYCQAQAPDERSALCAECLAEADADSEITVRIGFLHPVARVVGQLLEPWEDEAPAPPWQPVDTLTVDGQPHYSWLEASERRVTIGPLRVGTLLAKKTTRKFTFPALRRVTPLRDAAGSTHAVLAREQQALRGVVQLAATRCASGAVRFSVHVVNLTPLAAEAPVTRDAALVRACASTHAVLSLTGGAFVSMTDPPAAHRAAASACRNDGAWPVLVGRPGDRDTLLAAPIILYDYPEIAPESPGDLFDGTEIDEILTLRILTLTDEEQRAAAALDPAGAALIQRTQNLAADQLQRLHGALRPPRIVR
jgi:hypothetical protein